MYSFTTCTNNITNLISFVKIFLLQDDYKRLFFRISSIMNNAAKDASSNTNISKIVINGVTIQYGRVTNVGNSGVTVTLSSPYTSATTYIGLLGCYYNTSNTWEPNSIQLQSNTKILIRVPNGNAAQVYWATIGY